MDKVYKEGILPAIMDYEEVEILGSQKSHDPHEVIKIYH